MLNRLVKLIVAFIFGSMPTLAAAALPGWAIDEIYSNVDGSVQFVVASTLDHGAQHVGGRTLVASGNGVENTFAFPADLPGDSAGHSLLIATQGFADLGLIRPDYVVPNGFFPVSNGVIWVPSGYGYDYPTLPVYSIFAYWVPHGPFTFADDVPDAIESRYFPAVAVNFAGQRYSFIVPAFPPAPPQPPPAPSAEIGPRFTGIWYDPAQIGHGIFIEVLPENRLLAWWFTYNPAGTEQAWFGGVGTYSGNTPVNVPVYQATGGRWIPDFDPSQIVNSPWGTLTFTFTDCSHGSVDFNSTTGYGSGSMSLTRLTLPAGLTCP